MSFENSAFTSAYRVDLIEHPYLSYELGLCSPFAHIAAAESIGRYIEMKRGLQAFSFRHLFGASSIAGTMFEMTCHRMLCNDADQKFKMKILLPEPKTEETKEGSANAESKSRKQKTPKSEKFVSTLVVACTHVLS